VGNLREDKQIGTFEVKRDLIDRHPELVIEMFKDILIVRAEMDYATDAIEYFAYSDRFKRAEHGRPTKYIVQEDIEKTTNMAGDILFTLVKLRLEPLVPEEAE
jgi:hypothetical protein